MQISMKEETYNPLQMSRVDAGFIRLVLFSTFALGNELGASSCWVSLASSLNRKDLDAHLKAI